jgi:hypothetical protein
MLGRLGACQREGCRRTNAIVAVTQFDARGWAPQIRRSRRSQGPAMPRERPGRGRRRVVCILTLAALWKIARDAKERMLAPPPPGGSKPIVAATACTHRARLGAQASASTCLLPRVCTTSPLSPLPLRTSCLETDTRWGPPLALSGVLCLNPRSVLPAFWLLRKGEIARRCAVGPATRRQRERLLRRSMRRQLLAFSL